MSAFRQVPHEQIAIRIGLKFAGKRLRVRVVADGDKNTRDLEQSLFFGFQLRNFTARISPFSSATYCVTTVFQIGSIFSCASTRSAMIFEARKLSRR